MSVEELETLTIGMNGVVLHHEGETFNFIDDDVLFSENYALTLNQLKVHDFEDWLDVDYIGLSSCVGGGIDATLKEMFAMQNCELLDAKGNDSTTFESQIIINN